jgi:hypothetical protein
VRQKVLILANCQGPALSKILEKVVDPDGKPVFELLSIKPVYELKATEQSLLEELCQKCDILLYQPHIKYQITPEWRTSDYWVSITSAKRIISFPSIYFGGYNPELTYLRNNHSHHLNDGFVDYHDKRIVKLFLDGYSKFELERMFSKLQPVRNDVIKLANDSISALRMREQEHDLDIIISDYIECNYQKERLFFTYNHPSNSILYEVIRQFMLLLKVESYNMYKDFSELLCFDLFPISTSVIKYLDLEFSSDQNGYLIQGKRYTKSEVVSRYFEVYSKNHIWVEEAATFRREEWLTRKKLILHIGQSKTGTTSFQSFCFKNQKKLVSQGILYPITGLKFSHHRLLAEHYKKECNDPQLIKKLKDEVESSDCPVIIISCEAFETLNKCQMEAILNDFSEFDISIVCSLRDRISWVQSMYSELVKKAWFTGTFSDFISYTCIHPWIDPIINWNYRLSIAENRMVRHINKLLKDEDNLNSWLDVFPKEKLYFINTSQCDLWSVLSQEFKINLSNLCPQKNRLNISPNIATTEATRMFFKGKKVSKIAYSKSLGFSKAIDKNISTDIEVNTFFVSRGQLDKFNFKFSKDDRWLMENFGFDRAGNAGVKTLKYMDGKKIKKFFQENREKITELYESWG